MDKLIDLESIKSMISSVVKENTMTDEEIDECGTACGCGSCTTTSSDLGPAVQYIGATKKKTKKEFLDFGTTEVNGNDAVVNSNNTENNEEEKETQKEFLDANATLGDVNVLGFMKKDSDNGKDESTLEEDEIEEMARGILAPQEIAKREYVTEYPNSGIKTSDQFLRKVINDPEAEGYDKYINRLAYLLKTTDNSQLSDIAAEVILDNEDESDNYALAKAYANALLGHRKSMAKTSYDSKGLVNAYQRNVIKRGPYYKPGRDMVMQQPEQDVGLRVANLYNEVDPKESNKVLITFFRSAEWNSLSTRDKSRALTTISNEADLDERGLSLIKSVENYIGNEENE